MRRLFSNEVLMVTAEQAAAENLRWRAVNAPSTVTSAEQAQASQYRSQYYNVERPAQQARDAAIQQTIYQNRQMINAQEGLSYGGTHTQAQLAALSGSAAVGRQAYEQERSYYESAPSTEFLRIQGEYSARRNAIVSSSGISYPATGWMTLNTTAGAGEYTGRAAEYKSAYERQVYGIGAPDSEQEYYRRAAERAVVERAGYTAPAELGDIRTQQIRQGYGMFSQAVGLAGGEVASDYQITGRIIETQRQAAYATPTRRDERFFMGELQKWAEIPVEQASAYHDIGMESGKAIPANPYEYQADLAVEFLKGSPDKASELFSPVSGEMAQHLPGGVGVQEFAWEEAKTDYARQTGAAQTPYPERLSFMEGVTYLGAAEGKYGPYGKLAGGIDNGYANTISSPSALQTSQAMGVAPTTQVTSPKTKTVDDAFNAMKSQMIGFANVVLPGASGLLPSVQKEKEVAAGGFGAAISKGDIGGAYAAAEQFAFAGSATRAMPDISDWNTEIKIKESDTASDVLTFGATATKQVYTNIRENPIQDVALVALPGVFKVGEAGVSWVVARSAMSKAPVVSTAGRLASTPFAADIGTYGIKGGLAAVYGYEAGMSIIQAEGPMAKGKAFGNVVYQVGGMSLGSPLASSIKIKAPENIYAGREFVSGKVAMSPVEKAVFKAETTARSFVSANRGAYLDIATITKFGRFEEPMRRATPAIEETSLAGPYAKPIRATLAEQEHSMIGSSTVRQQFSPAIAEEFGLRKGKDVDVLFYSPKIAIKSLTQRTGLTEEAAKGVMDVHPIPSQYPRLKPSVEVDIATDESSFASRMFGDPYRRVATPRTASEVITGKEYGGKETYEAVQVQYGRKVAAVAAVIESPITKGYRAEKDIYDFVSLYGAQKKVAISRGTPAATFAKSDIAMKRFLEREITIGTEKGQKLGDATPTRKVKVSQLFEEGKVSSYERPAARFEPEIGYIPRAGRSSILPSRGVAYAFGSAVAPSASSAISSAMKSIVGSSAQPSSPSSRSPFGSSFVKSPPKGSLIGSSFVPSGMISPPSYKSSLLSSPPGVPPTYSGTSLFPPSLTPPTTTYTPPSTPPATPPYSPTLYPPSSPPSSPPSVPPYLTPPETPTRIPFGQLPGGGGGTRQAGGLGVTRWQRENLVATAEYLGRGMRDIGFGWGLGAGTYREKTTWAKTGKKKSKRRRKK
jgi:hypothetical protein